MRLFAHYFWGCSLSIFLITNVELETDLPYSIAPCIHVCAQGRNVQRRMMSHE